jgi:hypothetical protein
MFSLLLPHIYLPSLFIVFLSACVFFVVVVHCQSLVGHSLQSSYLESRDKRINIWCQTMQKLVKLSQRTIEVCLCVTIPSTQETKVAGCCLGSPIGKMRSPI